VGKESALVISAGQEVVNANKAANAKGQYRVMRKGKTRRDKATGAWANRLANRSQRAEENKAFHNKK
jgi:hypothetical protein